MWICIKYYFCFAIIVFFFFFIVILHLYYSTNENNVSHQLIRLNSRRTLIKGQKGGEVVFSTNLIAAIEKFQAFHWSIYYSRSFIQFVLFQKKKEKKRFSFVYGYSGSVLVPGQSCPANKDEVSEALAHSSSQRHTELRTDGGSSIYRVIHHTFI